MIQKYYKIRQKIVKACEKDPYFWVHVRIIMNHSYNRFDYHYRELDACWLHKYMRDEDEAKYVLSNMEEAGFIAVKYNYSKDEWVYAMLYKVNVSCADVQYFELMLNAEKNEKNQ